MKASDGGLIFCFIWRYLTRGRLKLSDGLLLTVLIRMRLVAAALLAAAFAATVADAVGLLFEHKLAQYISHT